jgi:UDP-N-acetylmuramate: L-alanyl-gamma-D-glutamyl-meso-diaminopimelate ligase
MQNAEGARLVCRQLGIGDKAFYEAIMHFKGAGKRLQLLGKRGNTSVFLDFAHSPSKVEATVNATKELFAGRRLTACLELHTYSSLNSKFLEHYRHTMEKADEAAVFFNPETIKHKRLGMISKEDVMQAFDKPGMEVFTTREELEAWINGKRWEDAVLLLMSSGNFSGIDFRVLTENLLNTIIV